MYILQKSDNVYHTYSSRGPNYGCVHRLGIGLGRVDYIYYMNIYYLLSPVFVVFACCPLERSLLEPYSHTDNLLS